MPSLKRKLADIVEAFLGASIVRPGQVGLLYEREHLRRFFAHFSVDCVFDVGANEGQYAEMLRQRVGYKGPIISFEPVPEVAARLRAKAASDPAWHIVELALDKSAGERMFHVMEGSEFSSLKTPAHSGVDICDDKNKILRSIPIITSSLEIEFKLWLNRIQFERPFLKLDTQGNDLDVIRGAGDSLQKFVGLQSELAVRPLYSGVDPFDNALAYYKSKGFEISAFVPNNVGHFPFLLEFDCIMLQKRFYTTNSTLA